MKRTKYSILLLFVFTTILSCDKLDELTEFDVTDGFSTTVNINLSEVSNEPQLFSESSTIALSSNQDIQDNLDLIQDIRINSLTYEISNYNAEQDSMIMLTEASLSFANSNISVNDINLQQADNDNTLFSISDSELLNSIGNILENTPTIEAMVSGTISGSPVSFNVIINVNLTATIDVL
ncbi:hypothetical protein [Winogradskyella sp. PG-2]|uniref:hypothetical protein n=1 Tax=Winogradskyella sp. PG-2 TaxID=754409 RepID=UPI0004588274|nr:hypothetical protein [Winogradskyella sp. PG-2]BAO76218.1 hypothetical protein WPG_1988 [Winogradskyella sp. PG-2]